MPNIEYLLRQLCAEDNDYQDSTKFKITLSSKFNSLNYDSLVFTYENQGTTYGTAYTSIAFESWRNAEDDPVYISENPYVFNLFVSDVYVGGNNAEYVYCYAKALNGNYYYVGYDRVLKDVSYTITDDLNISDSARWTQIDGTVTINTAGISFLDNLEIIDDYNNNISFNVVDGDLTAFMLTPNRYYYLKIEDDYNFESIVWINESIDTYHLYYIAEGTTLKVFNTNVDYYFINTYRGLNAFYTRTSLTQNYYTYTHQYKLASSSTYNSVSYYINNRLAVVGLSDNTNYTLKSKVEYATGYGTATETETENKNTLVTSDMRVVCSVNGVSVEFEIINNGSGNTYSFATGKLNSNLTESSFSSYSSNDTYTFNNLDANTDYLILARVKNSSNVITYLCEKFTTENNRPSQFSWSTAKNKGSTFSLTATEWVNLQNNINAVRVYKGLNAITVDNVASGSNIAASKYNALGNAIKAITGYGSYIPTVSAGDNITGYENSSNVGNINIIVNELNAIP